MSYDFSQAVYVFLLFALRYFKKKVFGDLRYAHLTAFFLELLF